MTEEVINSDTEFVMLDEQIGAEVTGLGLNVHVDTESVTGMLSLGPSEALRLADFIGLHRAELDALAQVVDGPRPAEPLWVHQGGGPEPIPTNTGVPYSNAQHGE